MQNYIGFDTETTGLDLEESRIIQAAVVGVGEEVTYINPGIPIPQEAVAIHGISNEFVELNGFSPLEGIKKIRDQLSDETRPIVGCNLQFDLTILDCECRRYGIEPLNLNNRAIYDVLILDRGLDKYRKGSRKLTALVEHYGVQQEKAHDALGDVKMTVGVLEKMQEKFPEITTWTTTDLIAKQRQFQYKWAVSYEKWCLDNGKRVAINHGFPYVPLVKEVTGLDSFNINNEIKTNSISTLV